MCAISGMFSACKGLLLIFNMCRTISGLLNAALKMPLRLQMSFSHARQVLTSIMACNQIQVSAAVRVELALFKGRGLVLQQFSAGSTLM